jgi:ribosome-associated protein
MPLQIDADVTIPDSELSCTFVRASGPGGQNVNKVASAVQLRFDLPVNSSLNASAKQRLRALAGRRITADGALLIIARNHRTQERNRAEALERLRDLVSRALIEPSVRRATKPTRASKLERLAGKTHRSRRKLLRGRPRWDE